MYDIKINKSSTSQIAQVEIHYMISCLSYSSGFYIYNYIISSMADI